MAQACQVNGKADEFHALAGGMDRRSKQGRIGSGFLTWRSKETRSRRRRACSFEQLEARRVLAAAIWNNAISPLNVNGDAGGVIAPNDVLAIVNELNGRMYSDPRTSSLPKQVDSDRPLPFFDVTCDGFASPIDALVVINYLNSGADNTPGDLTTQGGTWANASCSPQLVEGSGFATELTRHLTLPDDSSAVKVIFQAPEFDTASDGIRDAFEIEVTDTQGNPVAFAYQPDRDANYNWTEGQGVVFGPGVQTVTEPAGSDSSATIYLAGAEAGMEIVVRTRLVNNDGDDTTSVIIRGFEVIDSDVAAPAGQSGFASRATGIAPVPWEKLTDLSSSLAPGYGRTSLAGNNTDLLTDLTVTNQGRQAVMGRVIVVVENVSQLDVSPLRPDGFTPGGDPFFDLSDEMDGSPLQPGEMIRSREIRFRNNAGERFTYTLRTLGIVNRAPDGFRSSPVDSIEAGKTFRYTANANDPDGQALSYSLTQGPATVSINPSTGELVWQTTTEDVAQHRMVVRATDPHGLYVEQALNISVLETQQNRPPLFTSDPITDAIASSGFEITTVGVGDSPAGIGVISGFRGPRLVTANTGDQTIGVYAGENNDRFDDATTYATGFPTAEAQLFDVGYAVDIGLPKFTSGSDSNGVFGLDQGDLNGDGILDLVALYTYDSPSLGQEDQLVISAMLGDGGGGFGSPTEVYRYSIGHNSYDVRNLLLRDVNGDGSLDVLAVERRRDPRLITILGHGDGTFAAAIEQTFTTTLSDFRTADIDEDGKLDLIGRTADLGFGASYKAVWLKGIGDGTFTEPIIIGSAGGDPNCCYQTQQRPHDVLDLNGDGNLDIAFLTGAGVVIYHSDGNGNFTQALGVTPASAFARDWIRGGDFNGDGIADLVYHHSSRLEVLLGTGDGVNFTYQRGPNADGLLTNYSGTDDPKDIDGDGDLDLIFGHSSGDWTSTKVALNDGAGNFSITEYAMVDFSGVIQPFDAGDIARGAMFGDYNRDGVTDFSYFTSGGDFNGVGIRLGTRPGEFGQTRTIPWLPGSRYEDALPGDFNGDGIVDLLDTANDRIFLGFGDGSYRDPFPAIGVSRPTGYGSSADFNLDGIDDVVATRANQNGSRYYVALANGDGTFTVSDEQLVQSSFYGYSSTLIADFNLDGFPDFVAKTSVEGQIDVHINDPSNPGVFTRTFRITLPSGSQGINVSNWQESYAVADFTGDGIPDLAFAERNEETDDLIKLVVMAGDGLGDFSRHGEQAIFDDAFIASTYGNKFYAPGDYSAGDVNSDGNVDLIAVTNSGTRVFLNDGTGNFEFLSLLENPGTQQRGRDSWLVDINEDGQLDLIQSGNNANGPLNVRLGNGDGTFRNPQQFGLVGGIPGNISRQPFAHLDGDGHLDFVYATGSVSNYASDTASIFAGRRDDLVDLVAVDLNGDGNEEILAIQEQMDRLQVFVGDNLGRLTRQPDLLTGRAPQAIAAVDLDGDGKLELLAANRASRSLSVFTGAIGAGYTSAEFPVGRGPIDVAAADLDGDGNQDIVVLDDAENALWLFRGNGTETLGTPTSIALGDKPSRFSMADATGDGIVDAVITLPNSNRLMILPGDGSGAFGAPLYVSLAAAPSDVAVVDLNDDGNPDLAATLTSLNVLSVLYGRGNNQFSKAQQINVGAAPTRVTLADADVDGRFDFIVANSGDATASVIYNRFDPNEVYRYDADAVDPDDDNLTYAIVDGPGGLIINSETGALLWAASPDQVGVHAVTISADDGRGGVATQSFKIDVVAARANAGPLIATQPQTSIGSGEAFSYQATALDNDRDALRYRLLDAPPGATIDPTTGLIRWDGRSDTAVRLSDGNIVVPADESLRPESITVEGWYNLSRLTRFQALITDPLYYVGVHETNQSLSVVISFTDAGDRISFFAPVRPVTDRWYHVALTYDAATGAATLYIDGLVAGSGTTPTPQPMAFSSNAQTSVGDRGNRATQAVIDNYRIWNVARSAAEIQEGMARQYENDPRLVLDLRFGDVQEQTVQDHSMYGNTGYRVSGGLSPQMVDGLTDTGTYSFSVAVEDGRGGFDQQNFEVSVLPELRGGIAGHLFHDINGNGVQDTGSQAGVAAEPSLQDWHLYVDTNGNAYRDPGEPQTTTDANGNYSFVGLLPGEYPLRVSPVAGYDVPLDANNVSVTASQTTAFDLAIEQLSLSQIRGKLVTEEGDAIAFWKAYADLDDDGSRDDNEPMGVSDRNGNYAIAGLDAGTYTIRPDVPAGWTDRAGRNGLSVNLAADAISADNNFVLAATNTSVTGGVHFVTKPATRLEARQTFRYAAIAMGVVDEAITYDLSLAPDGMTIDPLSGLTAWRPTIGQVGEHLVVLRATSASGSIALHDFKIEVTAPNTPPIISAPSRVAGYVGLNYAYEVIAQDPESTTLAYSLNQSPTGASIDPATGQLNWTPTASDIGSHEFTASVTDEAGASTTVTWNVNVTNDAPAVLPLNVALPRATAAISTDYFSRIRGNDALGRPVTWTLESGPDGLHVDSNGTIHWTPIAEQLGSQPVRLGGVTADGVTETVAFAIDVTGRSRNVTPEIQSTPLISISLGQTYSYDVRVSDTDRDIIAFTLLDAPAGMSIHPSLGTLRWAPNADQLGESSVTVQVSDPAGATDTQEFTIKVSRFGGPPRIASIPPTQAYVGTAFLHSVIALDSEGDPLTYTLLAAPIGMSISETTGEIVWTPGLDQVGEQDVVIQVSDGIGGASTQAFAVNVSSGTPNLPPTITSSSPRFGAVGSSFAYTLVATDPENNSIAYSLGRGPAGMAIDAATGLVTWTPTADQTGKHVVTLIATDAGGASAIESFEFDVLAQNTLPSIGSTPPAEVAAGAVFIHDVRARDADLDQLTFELTQAPAGAEVDSFGRIRWQTSVPLIGSHDFKVVVSDPRGGQATQSFTLAVIEDIIPPKISLIENLGDGQRNILPWQGPFRVYVKAIDNVAIASLTLKANGREIPLDAAGTATFTFEEWTFQNIVATATAIDTNGNISTKTIDFDYDFPEGWSGAGTSDIPTATITSPSDAQSVTGMVRIVGTAAHEDLFGYKLSYRHVDETKFTQFHESTTGVTAGELGVWDTSLLLNDEYVIRLEVATNAGVVNVAEHHVGLAGELKLGNFRLSFTDMVIPVAGIPIEITRIYDTLQADREGDFGYGWRLEYRNTDLRVGLPKSGLEDIGIYSALRPGVKVYLNVPGQGRQGFTFNPDIRVLPGFGGQNLTLARPRFTPDPGVTSTLSTGTSGYLQVNELGELFAPGGIPYNPASPDFGGAYVLSTTQGFTYRIDGASGDLLTATDRNGNTLTFTETRVGDSSGNEIEIKRDLEGRIVEIADLQGNASRYEYSSAGELAAFIDRNANRTEYSYSDSAQHLLDGIDDPLNRNPLRQEYDASGRIVAIITPNGNRTELEFDARHSLHTSRNALGQTVTVEYDYAGRVVRQVDALGGETRIEYDAAGNETAKVDELGNRREFLFDSRHNLILERDESGHEVRYVYNAGNDALSVTDAFGQTTTRSYDRAGNMLTERHADGSTTTFEYDARGNLVAETDQLQQVTRHQYDSSGNRIRTIDSSGNTTDTTFTLNNLRSSTTRLQTTAQGVEEVTTRYAYDAEGRRIGVTDAEGNISHTEYDAVGNVTAEVDPLGNRTEYLYNDDGVRISTVYADGTSSTKEVDPNGQVLARVAASGIRTVFQYDELGRPTRTVLPDTTPDDLSDNPRQMTFYDKSGRVTSTVNPLGAVTEFEFDQLGRTILERDALGNETHLEYDALHRVVSTTDALGRITHFDYLEGGRVRQIRFPDGSVIVSETDVLGNLVASIDALGSSVRYEYDSAGNLVSVVDPAGAKTTFAYDELGNRVSQTDALGRTTRFEYDKLSRLISKVLPDGQRNTIVYDAKGNQIVVVDFNGDRSVFQYDSRGRMVRETTPQQVATFGYTVDGLMERYEDSTGITLYDYDALNRLLKRTAPDGNTVEYTYDDNGNVLTIETMSGITAYAYDGLDQSRSVSYGIGLETHFTYDAVGNLLTTENPNGVVETRTYDALDRAIQIVQTNATETLASYATTYDAAGRKIETVEMDGRTVRYAYDIASRLISETISNPIEQLRVLEYAYDHAGNRTSKRDSLEGLTVYEYNANDQLLTETSPVNRIDYTNDANGNLISQINSNGDRREYRWDSSNQLLSATISEAGVETETQYTYDMDGIRVSATVDGEKTNYLIDSTQQYDTAIVEYSDAGVFRTHVFADGVLATQQSGEWYYYQTDTLDNVRRVTDGTGGVVNQTEFDAFGNVLDSQITVELPFAYRSEYRDAQLGWDYLRARYYDPNAGRFTSHDPFAGIPELPVSLHRYLYAYSDPVNGRDPSGEITLTDLQFTYVLIGIVSAFGVYEVTTGRSKIREFPASKAQHAGSVVDIDGPRMDYIRNHRRFQSFVGQYTRIGDIFITDKHTVSMLEYSVGGRSRIGSDQIAQIVSPNEVVFANKYPDRPDPNMIRQIIRQDQVFEIQTSGGVIGIEG